MGMGYVFICVRQKNRAMNKNQSVIANDIRIIYYDFKKCEMNMKFSPLYIVVIYTYIQFDEKCY